jgi:hypothetical protein
LDHQFLLQELIDRKNCLDLEEDYKEIAEMIFTKPIETYQVITFERLNIFYHSGRLRVHLEPDNKNQLGEPAILVLHSNPSVHFIHQCKVVFEVSEFLDCPIIDVATAADLKIFQRVFHKDQHW